MKTLTTPGLLFLALLTTSGCQGGPPNPQTDASRPKVEAAANALTPPAWAAGATMYEVNLRQFSEQGTIAAFAEHLPRLHELGVKILWFMPIHPIGQVERKGSLGSYYAAADYRAINPEHGTLEEFKALVNQAHELGLYVILDWVANHTAWDHVWAAEHPDWYTRDEAGAFQSPVPDWSDVIDLDYDNDQMRAAMRADLRFWVEEVDVDGFRCDVASMVPTDFWVGVQQELSGIKPVFLLAESDEPELHEAAFHMTYAWNVHRLMNRVAAGKTPADSLLRLVAKERADFPAGALRLQFTSNHDENSWNGTVFERLGEGAAACAALTFTLPDMPLIYSGQEAGLDKRLAFFERDPISWRPHAMGDIYKTLIGLRKEHRALWAGAAGGAIEVLETSAPVVAYWRVKGGDRVLTLANLSAMPARIELDLSSTPGPFRDALGHDRFMFSARTAIALAPWQARILVRVPGAQP